MKFKNLLFLTLAVRIVLFLMLGAAGRATADTSGDQPTCETFPFIVPVEIPPGEAALFRWNAEEGRLESLTFGEGVPSGDRLGKILAVYPEWLRKPIRDKVAELGMIPLSATGIHSSDLDGSSGEELIIRREGGDYIVLYPPYFRLDNGRAFVAPVSDALDICFTDFDGDGIGDVVSLCRDGRVLLHSGSSMTSEVELSSAPGARFVSAGDLDGDDREEIVLSFPGIGIGVFHEEIPMSSSRGKPESDPVRSGRFYEWERFSGEDWGDRSFTTAIVPSSAPGTGEIYVALEDGIIERWGKSGAGGPWRLLKSHSIPVTRPYLEWGDLDGDEIPDLAAAGENGEILVWKGIIRREAASDKKASSVDPGSGVVEGCEKLEPLTGRNDRTSVSPFFYEKEPSRFYGMTPGYACAPAFHDIDRDGVAELLVGEKSGRVLVYTAGGDLMGEIPGIAACGGFTKLATGDMDGDGISELVVGSATGDVTLYSIGTDIDGLLQSNPSIVAGFRMEGRYADPALADLDMNGIPELLIGCEDGDIHIFTPLDRESIVVEEGVPRVDSLSFVDAGVLGEIGESPFSSPATGDITGDGVSDLVLGERTGMLRFFRGVVRDDSSGPDPFFRKIFFEEMEEPAGLDLGEYVSPAIHDLEGDGRIELVVGNAGGKVLVYGMDQNTLVEKDCWEFAPQAGFTSIEEYYGVYIPEHSLLSGWNDSTSVSAFVDFLEEVEDPYRDEVGFAAANLPVEILRTMLRRGEEGILLDNAKQIYRQAEKLSYVTLVENADSTTVRYVMEEGTEVECPASIYYWWVVHPRIIYELPACVDASYWEYPPEHYGMSRSEWLRHEPDPGIYSPSQGSTFWRNSLPGDRRYGSSLMDAVSPSAIFREAVRNLHSWLSHNGTDPFMTFGYETQDLQPLVILAKHYGSCGEQSILNAACARSVLVPIRVVGCRGEDHQWNEFWEDGEWIHWDVNYRLDAAIDAPWTSGEGRDHRAKTISTITGWRGDERILHITTDVHNPSGFEYTKAGRGYTDTARLTIDVSDSEGSPVDGALVILRSHWQSRNLASTWGHTDTGGKIAFDVGYEPEGGYTVEILSPFGSAGSWNLPIEEEREYRFSYRLPGVKPEACRLWARGDTFSPLISFSGLKIGTGDPKDDVSTSRPRATDLKSFLRNPVTPGPGHPDRLRLELRNSSGVFSAPAVVGTRLRRDAGYLEKEYGYRGVKAGPVQVGALTDDLEIMIIPAGSRVSGWEKIPTVWEDGNRFRRGHRGIGLYLSETPAGRDANGPVSLEDDFYIALLNRKTAVTALKADACFLFDGEESPPEIAVADSGFCFTGEVADNLALAGLEVSFDDGQRWHDITDETGFDDDVRRTGNFTWKPERFGVLPEGGYMVRFRATDHGSFSAVSSVIPMMISASDSFPDQTVRQDNPNSPLPRSSWELGPFRIPESAPFLEIRTEGKTPGMDIDLFLFHDENGDGFVNGMDENIVKSTSPVSEERIFLDQPKKGLYWLYVHGWKVPDDGGVFSLWMSESIAPVIAGKRQPVGEINDRMQKGPLVLSCAYPGISSIDRSRTVLALNDEDVTSCASVSDSLIDFPLEMELEEGRLYNVHLVLCDYCDICETVQWSFTIDRKAPSLRIIRPLLSEPVTGSLNVRVKAADRHGVSRVICRIPGKDDVTLRAVKDKKNIYDGRIDVSDLPGGSLYIECIAVDKAGNEKVRRGEVNVYRN